MRSQTTKEDPRKLVSPEAAEIVLRLLLQPYFYLSAAVSLETQLYIWVIVKVRVMF